MISDYHFFTKYFTYQTFISAILSAKHFFQNLEVSYLWSDTQSTMFNHILWNIISSILNGINLTVKGLSDNFRLLFAVLSSTFYDETSLTINEGQYLDISYEKQLNVNLNEYLEMIKKRPPYL